MTRKDSPLMDIKEAQAYLRLGSTDTIRKYHREGRLPCYKIGGHGRGYRTVYRKADLDKLLIREE